MYFTQDDYRKIEEWLQRNSSKDSELNEATPLSGNEIISIVQANHNRKISIKDFVNQIFRVGSPDFLNVTDKFGLSFITLEEAIQAIPTKIRKQGQVITFLNTEGNWTLFQFMGASNQWNNPEFWKDLDFTIDLIAKYIHVNKCPFVKELYINEDGKNEELTVLNSIVLEEGKAVYITFSSTLGTIKGYTPLNITSVNECNKILPITTTGKEDGILLGYIIVDWKDVESSNINNHINNICYYLDYSPSIKANIYKEDIEDTTGQALNSLSNRITANTNNINTNATNINTANSNIEKLNREKQDKLVSGTNIKTINGNSVLGEGNIEIEGGGGTSEGDNILKVRYIPEDIIFMITFGSLLLPDDEAIIEFRTTGEISPTTWPKLKSSLESLFEEGDIWPPSVTAMEEVFDYNANIYAEMTQMINSGDYKLIVVVNSQDFSPIEDDGSSTYVISQPIGLYITGDGNRFKLVGNGGDFMYLLPDGGFILDVTTTDSIYIPKEEFELTGHSKDNNKKVYETRNDGDFKIRFILDEYGTYFNDEMSSILNTYTDTLSSSFFVTFFHNNAIKQACIESDGTTTVTELFSFTNL